MIPWQTLHDIGQILEDGELDEIELENEEFRVKMSRTPPGPSTTASPPSESGRSTADAEGSSRTPTDSGGGIPSDWETIESPMVGTFYEAPAPAADPFVEVGDRVSYDTTVCIIEAMKLMNEIEAETEGVIKEVCREDAEAVSKGDVLFYVEPD